MSEFLVRLREGDAEHPPLSATSAARTVVAVRGFHKFAVARRAGRRPTRRPAVKPPTPAKRLPKALPLADVEAILEAAGAPGTTLALRDRALLELLYGTGARISEAVGLDVDDLDLVDGTVLLRGKGSKERLVPVGSFAREAVDAYLVRGRPELVDGRPRAPPALFLNARGGRLSRQSAWAVLAKAADRAGVTARRLAAHPAALLRDPPARRRRRRPRRPGAARATRRSRPPRSTRWSPSTTCVRSSPPRTLGRSADGERRHAHEAGGSRRHGHRGRAVRRVHHLGRRPGAEPLPAPGRGDHRAPGGRQRHPRDADRARGSRWSPTAAHLRRARRRPGQLLHRADQGAGEREVLRAVRGLRRRRRRDAHRRRVGQRRRPDHLLHRRGARQHRAARGRPRRRRAWW